MSYAIRLTLGPPQARAGMPRVARYIAVSDAVARALQSELGAAPDRIDMVHGFVEDTGLSAQEHSATRAAVLGALAWPADAFVVGGCGGIGWRKGTDLFLQLARRCVELDLPPTLRFLWVGGPAAEAPEAVQFAHDVAALGLGEVCRRVPSNANVHEYYAAMDVFALTSREDPFPLVMLEAGIQGVPTICFAGSGGGEEYVGAEAGLVVPYADVHAFADAVHRLHADAPLRRQLGEAARRKVHTHHSLSSQGPKMLASIERCLAAGA